MLKHQLLSSASVILSKSASKIRLTVTKRRKPFALYAPVIITKNKNDTMSAAEAPVGPRDPADPSKPDSNAHRRLDDSSDDEALPKAQTKLAPPNMKYFPLGYKDAAYQWWCGVTPAASECSVLRHIPVLKEAADSLGNFDPSPTPDLAGTRVWRRSLVQLPGKDRALNEVAVERVGEEPKETLVMLHGYGAGLGFFYQNFEPLTRPAGLRLYALDMLGMGNSTRPSFRITAKDKEDKVLEAESFFVDALEDWRRERKIERFTLLGHSLGGYLAVSYALKYPGRLNKLILASPVGIPEDPYAVTAALPEPAESTMVNEFAQDQQQTTTDGGDLLKTIDNPAAATDAASANTTTTSTTPTAENKTRRPLPGWLVWLWDQNVSPFSIVRMSGPFGPRVVSAWTHRRFNHLPEPESKSLHDYAFNIFKQKGSGEYALTYLLAPGAYARRPVINRIAGVGRQTIPAEQSAPPATDPTATTTTKTGPTKETGFPVVLMYGENDWMDVEGGRAAAEKLRAAREAALATATDEERRRERGAAKVVIVPKAGHHLYLDNPECFNRIVAREMDKTMRERRAGEV